MVQRYTVTKDADMLAPDWLAKHIDYRTAKIVHRIRDGYTEVKGVKLYDDVAEIGDVIVFDGKRLSVEKR